MVAQLFVVKPVTEEIENLFTNDYQFVLLAGLGGHTGTALFSAISQFFADKKKDLLVITFVPFVLEKERYKVANTAKKVFQDYSNIHYIENTKLAEEFNHLKLEGAFKEANKKVYSIYKENIKTVSSKQVVHEHLSKYFRRFWNVLLT